MYVYACVLAFLSTCCAAVDFDSLGESFFLARRRCKAKLNGSFWKALRKRPKLVCKTAFPDCDQLCQFCCELASLAYIPLIIDNLHQVPLLDNSITVALYFCLTVVFIKDRWENRRD